MRLFTDDQLAQLIENGQPENQGKDWLPVVKLVLPRTGCCWLLSEVRSGMNRLYGYGIADYGTGHIHSGFIDLTELEWMADPIHADRVRSDDAFDPKYTISVYLTAARMCSAIVEDEDTLQEAWEYNLAAEKPPSEFEAAIRMKLVP